MIYEFPDFDRYSPSHLAALRPEMERLAGIMRRNLAVLHDLLGVETRPSDLDHEYDRLRTELFEARSYNATLENELEYARTRVADLEQRVGEYEDDGERALYASVGLVATAHRVVVSAARRSLLGHLHPDRAPLSEKSAATERFQAMSAAFDRIAELRK